MDAKLFMELLALFAVLTGLMTQTLKKLFDEEGWKYSANIMAIVIALIVGCGGTMIYYAGYGIEYSVMNIIFAILMGIASAMCAMLGYDKVVQAIKQVSK